MGDEKHMCVYSFALNALHARENTCRVVFIEELNPNANVNE
jgi:hypothetical protein